MCPCGESFMSGHNLFIHSPLLATERQMTTKNGLEIESNLYASMMSAKNIDKTKTIHFLQTTGLWYRRYWEEVQDMRMGQPQWRMTKI
jgi:hypothetical protein